MARVLKTARKNANQFLLGMWRLVAANVDDALLLSGCAAIVYGVSMWSVPAAWICAGIMLIALGVLVGKVKVQDVAE